MIEQEKSDSSVELKSSAQHAPTQQRQENPRPPKVISQDLKFQGDLQMYAAEDEYDKIYECFKTQLEFYHSVPPITYYDQFFIPYLQRARGLAMIYTIASLIREIVVKYPPTLFPKLVWSPMCDPPHEPGAPPNPSQHWDRLLSLVQIVAHGEPPPIPENHKKKDYGSTDLRMKGNRTFLEICNEILDTDLEMCADIKVSMMYRLMMEGFLRGRFSLRIIIEEVMTAICFEPVDDRKKHKIPNILVVQHLLYLMLQTIERTEKDLQPTLTFARESRSQSSLGTQSDWYLTLAEAVRQLKSTRKQLLFFDTMRDTQQKSILLHKMLERCDAKNALKAADALSLELLVTYIRFHKSARLRGKHLIEFSLVVAVLTSVAISLFNTPMHARGSIRTELESLRSIWTADDPPFSLRLCFFEALRLCGSKESEPQRSDVDAEDSEELSEESEFEKLPEEFDEELEINMPMETKFVLKCFIDHNDYFLKRPLFLSFGVVYDTEDPLRNDLSLVGRRNMMMSKSNVR